MKADYNKHLNGAGNVFVSSVNHGYQPAPILLVVKYASGQHKNNIAADMNGIEAELIKMGQLNLDICLHRHIGTLCETKQLPEE